MAGSLPMELMDELFAGIEKEVEEKPDPVYASDKQRGYMNYRGVEPVVYTGPFEDRRHLNEVIAEAVKFSNEFGRTHKDEKNKPQQPASGEASAFGDPSSFDSFEVYMSNALTLSRCNSNEQVNLPFRTAGHCTYPVGTFKACQFLKCLINTEHLIDFPSVLP
jgi:hypothetical protein